LREKKDMCVGWLGKKGCPTTRQKERERSGHDKKKKKEAGKNHGRIIKIK